MENNSMEAKLDALAKRVDILEASNKKLVHENERLRDINKIQNLMSKEAYLFEAHLHEERLKLSPTVP